MADRTLLLKLVSDMGSVSKDTKAMTGQLSKFGSTVKTIGAGLGLAFGINEAINLMGDAISKASDLGEQQSKVTAVFEDSADEVKDWARTLDTSFGITETAALTSAGQIGNLATSMGLTETAAADMAEKVTELAGDLSSFNNVPVTEVLQALQSGLIGEAEPMRKFGVLLSAAAVDAKAMADNHLKAKSAITDAMRVTARYNIILGQTSKAQGDAAKTGDTYAGIQRSMDVTTDRLTTRFGQFLLTAAKPMLSFLADAVEGWDDLIRIIGGWDPALDARLVFFNRQVEKMAEHFGFTTDEAHRMFDELQQRGFIFEEGASDADKMTDQLSALRKEMMHTRVGMQVAGRGVAEDFHVLASDIHTDTLRITDDLMGLPISVVHAAQGMHQAIKDGKAPIIAEFRDLAWQSKHPFADVNFALWLQKKHDKAMRLGMIAARHGRTTVAKQYFILAEQIRVSIMGLPAYVEEVAGKVINLFSLVDLFNGPITPPSTLPPPPKGETPAQRRRRLREERILRRRGGGGGGGNGANNRSVSGLAATASGFGATSAGWAFAGSPASRLDGGNTYNITINGAIDQYGTGRTVVKAVKAYESREGKRWRSSTS